MPRLTPRITSALTRARALDRTTVMFAVLTLGAFGGAAVARAAAEWISAVTTGPARYASAPIGGVDPFEAANVVAVVAACCAGAGVLLFGATLVFAVRRHRTPRLGGMLVTGVLVLVAGAVVAGFAAATQSDYEAIARLVVLRTALGALAVASLPAVVLAALRSRARRIAA